MQMAERTSMHGTMAISALAEVNMNSNLPAIRSMELFMKQREQENLLLNGTLVLKTFRKEMDAELTFSYVQS